MQNENVKSPTDVAQKLLNDSFVARDFNQLIGPSRLEVLDDVSAAELAELIEDEGPHLQALVLAHINARKSFETLEELPVKLRSQTLFLISKLEPTESTELDKLNRFLKEKIRMRGFHKMRGE